VIEVAEANGDVQFLAFIALMQWKYA